jgi:DMSO/TMAO reductase YedYZ molybdopterin-dependent catalytic subunit
LEDLLCNVGAAQPGIQGGPSHHFRARRSGYNNYYEFSEAKERVWKLAQRFEARPWQVEIKGLVQNPRKVNVDDLIKQITLEERVYRHRCVEAWSMVIPWSGHSNG